MGTRERWMEGCLYVRNSHRQSVEQLLESLGLRSEKSEASTVHITASCWCISGPACSTPIIIHTDSLMSDCFPLDCIKYCLIFVNLALI